MAELPVDTETYDALPDIDFHAGVMVVRSNRGLVHVGLIRLVSKEEVPPWPAELVLKTAEDEDGVKLFGIMVDGEPDKPWLVVEWEEKLFGAFFKAYKAEGVFVAEVYTPTMFHRALVVGTKVTMQETADVTAEEYKAVLAGELLRSPDELDKR